MKISKKTKRNFAVYCALVLVMTLFAAPAYAADDPLTVVNNLSNFIFGLFRAIGLILLGFGIVQIGFEIQRSEPKGQRVPYTGWRRHYYLCQGDTDPHYGLIPVSGKGRVRKPARPDSFLRRCVD